MKPHQYHQLLVELDRTLAVLDEASADFSIEDIQLRLRIATIRSQVLRAESGHPFALEGSDAAEAGGAPDADLTRAPWSQMLVSDRDQTSPGLSP